MQAEKNYVKDELRFKPFKLSLNVETREEAQALYAMFNNLRCSSLLKDDVREHVKKTIGGEFYVGEGIIANDVTYSRYY